MEKEYYLERLVGKVATNTAITTSTLIARKDDPDDIKVELTLQLYLGDYLLNIYNPMTILPSGKELPDLEGLKVIATNEDEKEAELVFDNGYRLLIDLREEAYEGPEAMYLSGPDDFWVVWR